MYLRVSTAINKLMSGHKFASTHYPYRKVISSYISTYDELVMHDQSHNPKHPNQAEPFALLAAREFNESGQSEARATCPRGWLRQPMKEINRLTKIKE